MSVPVSKTTWIACTCVVIALLLVVLGVSLAALLSKSPRTTPATGPALAGAGLAADDACANCPCPAPGPGPTPPTPPGPGCKTDDDVTPTCAPVKDPPKYDLVLTWYGVQTNGPQSAGVVTPAMYKTSATNMIRYMKGSPLGYTGILLQLDPPTGSNDYQGKPANYAAYVDTVCDVIEMVPPKYRVGIHAVVEADATWGFTPAHTYTHASKDGETVVHVGSNVLFREGTKTVPFEKMGTKLPAQFTLGALTAKAPVFYGSAGGAATARTLNTGSHDGVPNVGTGFPYQTPFTPPSTGSCPYQIFPDGCAEGTPPEECAKDWPSGCPGNMGRLAWYVCLINWRLMQRKISQRITMMNWDAEGNGPVGLACSIYQFMFGIDMFKTSKTVVDTVNPKYKKWILYQNGASGLNSSILTYKPDQTPCGNWADVNLPLSTNVKIGSVAMFQAAPEYYWFNGEDMGSVGGATPPPFGGMLPDLAKDGYVGCPQSAPGKPNYDKSCGCRDTVYQRYSKVDEGGAALLARLAPLYDTLNGGTRNLIATTTPTFSIEHLGHSQNASQFDLCINSRNFCSQLGSATDGNYACMADAKCIVRCGVANFFGNWTQACFKQFLDLFAKRYGVKSIMIYDGGFVSERWLAESFLALEPATLSKAERVANAQAKAKAAVKPSLKCASPPAADASSCPVGTDASSGCCKCPPSAGKTTQTWSMGIPNMRF
jgi:hypothetical protein